MQIVQSQPGYSESPWAGGSAVCISSLPSDPDTCTLRLENQCSWQGYLYDRLLALTSQFQGTEVTFEVGKSSARDHLWSSLRGSRQEHLRFFWGLAPDFQRSWPCLNKRIIQLPPLPLPPRSTTDFEILESLRTPSSEKVFQRKSHSESCFLFFCFRSFVRSA